ncbi:MAG: energy-dependent translational throttle protein EttA, partial [Planctomycetota bacterium]
LGVNGAGKSTLLRIMSGEDRDFDGDAGVMMKDVTVGYFKQEPDLDGDLTVAETVELAVADKRAVLERFNDLNMKLAEDLSPEAMEKTLKELDQVQNRIDAENLWEVDRMVEMAKDALRVPPDEAKIEPLSGGEKRRVYLAKLLLSSPDLLLLDEPTNHLDAASVGWLEKYLAAFKGTVVAITHDRYFLDNVAGWILEIERGRCLPFEGNYSAWLEAKQARLAIEEKQESKRQKTMKQELEWVRSTPKARATKNKARLERFQQMQDTKVDLADETAEIQIAPGPPLGDLVVEAEGVRKAYGDKLLYDDLSFRLPRGGIVGVIGANGTGKTTLFRMITGQEQPDAGTLRIGQKVKLAYVDQSRADLDPSKSVYEEISGGHDILELGGGQKMHARTYASKFNFKGPDQQQLVGTLSGGQRNRVHLAKLLRSGGNLLLLDEPSNDLDVDTLRSLEEALLTFRGCVMVSSHDRWFLDRIATHILAFEGDSKTTWFEGNYDLYERMKKERDGDVGPTRTKFQKIAA